MFTQSLFTHNKFHKHNYILGLMIITMLIFLTHEQSRSSESIPYRMIQQKSDLIDTLKRSKLSVFFYGQINTKQYQQYQNMLLSSVEQFPGIQFYFVPVNKFKLSRPNPSLSIYRQIKNGQWLLYKGIFSSQQIKKWIKQNCYDPLKDFTAQQLDQFFGQSKKGFILLDFGQFDLLKVKILMNQFCKKYSLSCGKITHKSFALNTLIQLMRAQDQPGVPKLAFWNSQTQKFQLSKKDPSQINQNELMQLYSGPEAILPFETELDVAQIIHPQTLIVENMQKNDQQL